MVIVRGVPILTVGSVLPSCLDKKKFSGQDRKKQCMLCADSIREDATR